MDAKPRNLLPEFDGSYPSRHPTPTASRSAHQLPNGKWELGSDFQSAMIKSAPMMVTKLTKGVNYGAFKAWASAVEDWVYSHTHIMPDELSPMAVWSVARMTLELELYSALEAKGALGSRSGSGPEAQWPTMMEHLREKLGCSRANLKLGLAVL